MATNFRAAYLPTVLMFALASCDPGYAPPTEGSAQAEPAPKTFKLFQIGQEVDFGSFSITLKNVEQRARIGEGAFGANAAEGGTFVAVEYKLKNSGSDPMSSRPNMVLLDPSGRSFDNNSDASFAYRTENDTSGNFTGDNLNPGLTITDRVAWEVSKEAFDPKTWTIAIEEQLGSRIALN